MDFYFPEKWKLVFKAFVIWGPQWHEQKSSLPFFLLNAFGHKSSVVQKRSMKSCQISLGQYHWREKKTSPLLALTPKYGHWTVLGLSVLIWLTSASTAHFCPFRYIQCGLSMMSWVDPYSFIESIHTLNKKIWIDSNLTVWIDSIKGYQLTQDVIDGPHCTANPFPVMTTGISLCSNSTL